MRGATSTPSNSPPSGGSWFNTERLHSSLGDIPPAEFEEHHYRQLTGTGELVETK